MEKFEPYIVSSKRNWGSDDARLTLEQINTGCLQRIANATEAMAIHHTKLIEELEYLRARSKRLQDYVEELENKLRAEKSAKTRFKNQNKVLKMTLEHFEKEKSDELTEDNE